MKCHFHFHDSLFDAWLLLFYLIFFTMIIKIHHEFHIILWWESDMSLSLITKANSDWWHGIYPVVALIPLVSSFFKLLSSLMSLPSKGSLIKFHLSMLWSSRFKCVLIYFQDSFVCSLLPIFIMSAYHDVYGIPVSAITQEKKLSSWKSPILPCFMYIFLFELF